MRYRTIAKFSAVPAALLTPMFANAQAFDATTAVADIGANSSTLTAVGGAIIGLAVLLVGIKYAKAALFS